MIVWWCYRIVSLNCDGEYREHRGVRHCQLCKWSIFCYTYQIIQKCIRWLIYILVRQWECMAKMLTMVIEQAPTYEGNQMAHDLTHHPDILRRKSDVFWFHASVEKIIWFPFWRIWKGEIMWKFKSPILGRGYFLNLNPSFPKLIATPSIYISTYTSPLSCKSVRYKSKSI